MCDGRDGLRAGMIAQQASAPFDGESDGDGDAWSSACVSVADTPARSRALALSALGENEYDVSAGAAKSSALK